MKQKIDILVQNINANLSMPPAVDSQVEEMHLALGTDPLSVASELRACLARWADDMTLSIDDRAYADKQLKALPSF
jgi:hypothetical protein